MTERFKKFTAMLLAGLLACFVLTACGDEVKVSADEPMSPGEIQNALKKASDFTVTIVGTYDYNWCIQKDNSIVWHKYAEDINGCYYDISTNTKYSPQSSDSWSAGILSGYNTPQNYAYDEIANRVEHISEIFNDSNYTAVSEGNYTATAEMLTAIDADALTISSTGLIYTIKIDNIWTITIDFNDVVLTLPTVS